MKNKELKLEGKLYFIIEEIIIKDKEWCVIDFPEVASISDWSRIWKMLKEILEDAMSGFGEGVVTTKMMVRKDRMTAFDMVINRYRLWFNINNNKFLRPLAPATAKMIERALIGHKAMIIDKDILITNNGKNKGLFPEVR